MGALEFSHTTQVLLFEIHHFFPINYVECQKDLVLFWEKPTIWDPMILHLMTKKEILLEMELDLPFEAVVWKDHLFCLNNYLHFQQDFVLFQESSTIWDLKFLHLVPPIEVVVRKDHQSYLIDYLNCQQ